MPSQEQPAVSVESAQGVTVIGLTRPEKRNAMRPVDCQRVGDLIRDSARNPEVRVIVLTGHGGYFSAGADLHWNSGNTSATLLPVMHRTVLDTYRCRKPVLAAVEGCCVGAAWSLALACDVVIAAADAYFAPPFTSRGLVPDAGIGWFLYQRVGPYEAARLMWFDGRLDAGQAAARGLVSEITGNGLALPRAMELAARLAAEPSRSVAVSKAVLRNSRTAALEEVLDAEFAHVGYNQADDEVTSQRTGFVAGLGQTAAQPQAT